MLLMRWRTYLVKAWKSVIIIVQYYVHLYTRCRAAGALEAPKSF